MPENLSSFIFSVGKIGYRTQSTCYWYRTTSAWQCHVGVREQHSADAAVTPAEDDGRACRESEKCYRYSVAIVLQSYGCESYEIRRANTEKKVIVGQQRQRNSGKFWVEMSFDRNLVPSPLLS